MASATRWSLSAQRATLSVRRGKCDGALTGSLMELLMGSLAERHPGARAPAEG